MPKRELTQAVVIQREGVPRLRLKAGQVFDFTAQELEELKRMNPDAIKPPQVAKEPEEVTLPSGKGDSTAGSSKKGAGKADADVEL